MAKMPPTLLQRGPSLHALATEIAMWLVVHHRGERSADVLTPLCSAVLDCFAGDTKAMRLEQPPALLDSHMCAHLPSCLRHSSCSLALALSPLWHLDLSSLPGSVF